MNSRRGKKGHYGPEDNKLEMVVFIDDVNMPHKEIYGAQPPLEILRLWLDFGFWYDLENREEKFLHDMTFIVTMRPPSSGTNTITHRFIRHFYYYYVEPFNEESLNKIFNSLMDWFFLKSKDKFPN